MRILVVCGAGASSTFVAMRLRHAADSRGIPLQALAGTEASLPIDLDSADVLLVGPPLKARYPEIRTLAEARGVHVVWLPSESFAESDGNRTLDRLIAVLPSGALSAPAGDQSV